MAHAGTPSDLAKQPAASSSTWKSLLSLIVIAAIGIGMVIAVLFISGGRATTAPAVDRAYDQIETQRGATALSGVATSNAVEKAAAARARAMSGVPVDNSLDAAVRAAAAKAAAAKAAAAKAGVSGIDPSYPSIASYLAQSGYIVDTSVDKSYQMDERPRGAALPGSKLDSTSFDRKYHELQRRAGNGQLP